MALAVLVDSQLDDEDGDGVARSEKRPGAFRTISEVAEDLGVPQHVLRFWESRFAQVRPVKRGGGRRYYRPDDVELLKGIRRLLHGQGYTIKGAQRILKQHGVRFVQAVGRGEVEAGAPAAAERDPDAAATETASLAASPSTEDVLHAVLHDLRACREALAGLRPGAVEEDADRDFEEL